MQTELADFIRDTPEGREAEAILRKCVHCGFCTATCPTYQVLGDDLDSPRGRIYLIKRALEGAPVTRQDPAASRPLPHLPRLRDHLPVGRALRPLVDIGRAVVEAQTRRAAASTRCARAAARLRPCRDRGFSACSPHRAPGAAAAARCRESKGPPASAAPPAIGRRRAMRARCWCSPAACSPRSRRRSTPPRRACSIALGISLIEAPRRRLLRRRALPPELPGGGPRRHARPDRRLVAAGRARRGRGDRHDGERLRRDGEGIRPPARAGPGVSRQGGAHRGADAATCAKCIPLDMRCPAARGAAESPSSRPARCSTASRCAARSKRCCARAGFELTPVRRRAPVLRLGRHLLAAAARDRRRAARAQARGAAGRARRELIATANIGCLTHLQGGTATPVRHWIELLDEA